MCCHKQRGNLLHSEEKREEFIVNFDPIFMFCINLTLQKVTFKLATCKQIYFDLTDLIVYYFSPLNLLGNLSSNNIVN